jgi:hypothetical protein
MTGWHDEEKAPVRRGRFTANDELLYYRNGDCPPFGIKGTILPPRWESIKASGKFSLNWREK